MIPWHETLVIGSDRGMTFELFGRHPSSFVFVYISKMDSGDEMELVALVVAMKGHSIDPDIASFGGLQWSFDLHKATKMKRNKTIDGAKIAWKPSFYRYQPPKPYFYKRIRSQAMGYPTFLRFFVLLINQWVKNYNILQFQPIPPKYQNPLMIVQNAFCFYGKFFISQLTNLTNQMKNFKWFKWTWFVATCRSYKNLFHVVTLTPTTNQRGFKLWLGKEFF